jgi:hypothetical protein
VSFLETVGRARTFLERDRRVSLRALRREFDLDPETLAELSDELVQVQGVAVLEGDVLVWTGETLPAAPPVGIPLPARDPRARTPKHLADKILQSKSALEGERKQVTVLFADVKSSMELAEQLDPEEWHRIMDRFFLGDRQDVSRTRPSTRRRDARGGAARSLATLQDGEFLYEEALYPELEYPFKHPLTQEVAAARSSRSGARERMRWWQLRSKSWMRSISTSAPRCSRITGSRQANQRAAG